MYSQWNEEEIIESLIKQLKFRDNWCVEFGALDGIFGSNTFNLIKNHKYNSVLIEASIKKFNLLKKNMEPYNSILFNEFITFEGRNTLDNILKKTSIPIDFDFLSIDIDGNDYWIFESINLYKPKIICIEFNHTIPNEVEYVQPRDFKIKRGASAYSLIKLATIKSYQLVEVTTTNLIFLRKDIFSKLQLKTKSLDDLRDDSKWRVFSFTGYDGTIIQSSSLRNPWLAFSLSKERIQILPFFLRKYPGDCNFIEKILIAFTLLTKDPINAVKRIKLKLKTLLK